MIELKDDSGKLLPEKIQTRVNEFIEHLKVVSWFKPNKDLKKSDVEKQVNFTLKCFGIEASIEYRKLESKQDWDSAWVSARDSAGASAWVSAWVSARDSAWVSARDSAWVSAWDSAWVSARDSAWVSARDSAGASAWVSACASIEVLLEDNVEFKKKYPNGAFIQLLKIWEMGLYPVGVLANNKKFVIYVPPISMEFNKDLFL